MKKTYKLYCNYCHYNRFTDGTDVGNLIEIKTSAVPGGSPRLENNKIIEPKQFPQRKKFKCPNCGRLILPKTINAITSEIDQNNPATGSQAGPERPPVSE